MNRIINLLSICFILILATGCTQTLRNAGRVGIEGGKLAAPQYAGVLTQIQRVLEREAPNPIDGFEFSIIYRFQGAIVDAKDITWEERFIRTGSADKGMPPPSGATARPIDDTPEDARLRAEISAILDAAGIGE